MGGISILRADREGAAVWSAFFFLTLSMEFQVDSSVGLLRSRLAQCLFLCPSMLLSPMLPQPILRSRPKSQSRLSICRRSLGRPAPLVRLPGRSTSPLHAETGPPRSLLPVQAVHGRLRFFHAAEVHKEVVVVARLESLRGVR